MLALLRLEGRQGWGGAYTQVWTEALTPPRGETFRQGKRVSSETALIDSHVLVDQSEPSLYTWGTRFHPSPASQVQVRSLKSPPSWPTAHAHCSLALGPWDAALCPGPAHQPGFLGHSRQLSSSEPSLQSVSPSQYQCSAMQLPSLQRNSLSEHLRMSGGRNGTAILQEPYRPPSLDYPQCPPSLPLRV